MQKFLKIFLALQLAFSVLVPTISYGQVTENAASISREEFEKKFASATYSVKEIPAMIKDLADMDLAAGYGISDFMAKEIYNRLDAAFTVVTAILVNKNLSQKERFDKTEELMNAIGAVFATSIRQHGEDKVDKEKLTKRLAEITTLEKAKDIFKEFYFDARNLVIPVQSARAKNLGGAETIWAPLERLNRNELNELAILRIQKYATEVIPQLQDDLNSKVKNYATKTWYDHWLDLTLRLREKRVQSQRATGFFYLGLAFYGLVAPHVDMVGPFTGYNDNTLFTSSLIYFSAWTVIGATKLSMASTKVVKMLKETILFMDKGVPIPTQRQTLMEKLKAIPSKAINSCRLMLGKKS